MPGPRLRAFLREPLVHFLLAGAGLFVLASTVMGDTGGERDIRLTRDDLLVYLQQRAQVFDETSFDHVLDAMTPAERRALEHDAALQQALYREGVALGLDRNDPLIRERVVQQMRLLLMEESATGLAVSPDEARAFFAAHRADYALPASLSFTHVYLRGANRKPEAEALLAQLRARRVSADQAGQYGERFLYQLNYADVGPALVGGQFGQPFADALFAAPAGTWSGPIQSEHGWHLVLVTDKAEPRTPAFDQVAAVVEQDALAEKRQRAADSALDRMLARYRVTVAE